MNFLSYYHNIMFKIYYAFTLLEILFFNAESIYKIKKKLKH
jgi:hypothetical protein